MKFKVVQGPHTLVAEAATQEEFERLAILKYKIPIYDNGTISHATADDSVGYKLQKP